MFNYNICIFKLIIFSLVHTDNSRVRIYIVNNEHRIELKFENDYNTTRDNKENVIIFIYLDI